MASSEPNLAKKRQRAADHSRVSIAEARKYLPVYKFRHEVCEKICKNDVVLVMAETG
mgnify:CR=1 FL=1